MKCRICGVFPARISCKLGSKKFYVVGHCLLFIYKNTANLLGEPVVVRSGAPGYGVPSSGAAPVRPPLVGEGESAGGGGVHHAAVTHVPGGQALLSASVWGCIQHCSSLMDFLEKKI